MCQIYLLFMKLLKYFIQWKYCHSFYPENECQTKTSGMKDYCSLCHVFILKLFFLPSITKHFLFTVRKLKKKGSICNRNNLRILRMLTLRIYWRHTDNFHWATSKRSGITDNKADSKEASFALISSRNDSAAVTATSTGASQGTRKEAK